MVIIFYEHSLEVLGIEDFLLLKSNPVSLVNIHRYAFIRSDVEEDIRKHGE